ncbi:MAG: M28 family peptidase [Chloroflexota bacterium]
MKINKTFSRVLFAISLGIFSGVVGCFAQTGFIHKIVEKVDDQKLAKTTKELCGDTLAYTGNLGLTLIKDRRQSAFGNELAANYLYYKLKENGCDARFTDTILNPGGPKFETVYSIKEGKNPKRIIILAAGFDSNSPKKDSISPGANMSASSCAIVIEAARIMQSIETDRTMIFALMDDMNNAGYGIGQLMDSLKKQGYESTKAIFLDNLGYKGETGYLTLNFADTTKNATIKHAFLQVSEILYPEEEVPATNKLYTPFGGWSTAFTDAEEVLFARNLKSDQPYLYSKDDTFERLELPFYFRNARTAIAAFALLADPIITSAADAPSHAELKATNPCRGTLRITSERALGTLKIFDLYGKEVYSGFEANSDALINAAGFAPGVYFIQSESGAAKFVKM